MITTLTEARTALKAWRRHTDVAADPSKSDKQRLDNGSKALSILDDLHAAGWQIVTHLSVDSIRPVK